MILFIRKRTIRIISFLLVLGVVGYSAIQFGGHMNDRRAMQTAASVNWGLSFQSEGTPPVANATAEYLRQFNAFYAHDTDEKIIYLTFDAGYENSHTNTILDVLKKHDIRAAFFLVGNYLHTAPDIVRRMVNEGHIVGNHTYSHPDMSKISDMESFEREIRKMEDAFREVTGLEIPRFYRPPQGKFNEDNLRMAKELGYTTVFWSLAYVDWYENNQPTRQEAFDKLIPRIHPGAIVMLHNTSRTNAEILDELLTKWKEMGYTFRTLDDLVGKSEIPKVPIVLSPAS